MSPLIPRPGGHPFVVTFRSLRTALLGGLVLAGAPLNVRGQLALATSAEVPYRHDSGWVRNESERSEIIISFPVLVSGAEWLRLYFDEIHLGDALVRITSYEDGDVQELRARHCVEWQNTSAYFNGESVHVDVEAPPRSGPYRLVLDRVDVGLPRQESQCGAEDNRELSNDPRVGRLFTAGSQHKCTAWIIEDCSRCLLTAGHCVPQLNGVVQFNIPLSDVSGSPQMPSSDDQYAVDPASIQRQVGAPSVGNDWAYFGVFANPNTNLSAGDAQGSSYALAAPPPGDGYSIQITGQGVDTTPPERNRAQQTHSGPHVATVGDQLHYQVDTEAGSSGSPVFWTGGNAAIGIHTNGGCKQSAPFMHNAGTAMTQSDLVAALTNPLGVCKLPELEPSDPQVSGYGLGVSISGDTAVVGARNDNSNTGAAFVFVRDENTWTQQAKLVANDGAAGDFFGYSVAISGDTVIVGSAGEGDGELACGAAYVFVRNGTSWGQQAKLKGSSCEKFDLFGYSVALHADTAVVGVPRDDENGSKSGAAYAFARVGGTWIEQGKLVPDDGGPDDWAGGAVAVSGDWAVVSAESDDDNGFNAGAAYVFRRVGGSWSQDGSKLLGDSVTGGGFGRDVAISGATIAIVAPFSSQGGIYVFSRGSGAWAMSQKLEPPGSSSTFGPSLSLSGPVLVAASSIGALTFLRGPSGFREAFPFCIPAPSTHDVAVSGDRVILRDQGNPGRVFAFSTSCRNATIYCAALVNSAGCLPAIRFSGVPSLTAASPFNLTATSVPGSKNGELQYSVTPLTGLPTGTGALGTAECIPTPVTLTPVQSSGDNGSMSPCPGSFTFDFNAWLREGNDPSITPGTTVYARFTYVDDGGAFGVTNAVAFEVLP